MEQRAPHIGLNLVFLVPGETGGMEIAARELIPRLIERAPARTRFSVFTGSSGPADWAGAAGVRLALDARSRVQWVLAEQSLLPVLAMRRRVDLLHSMASTAPLWGRFRRVVTVHDLIYARHPDAHSGLRQKGMRVLVPAAARRSQRVIVDSRCTRDDLVELTGVPAQRIDVVPLGLGAVRRAAPVDERELRTRLQLGSRRVLLSLSAKRPHKNLAALIRALALIAGEQRPLLVLPGYATWHERELRDLAARAGVEADVRFLGWLDDGELEGLWAIAEGFAYPSLYEGFGLPVLEAMARGVPVASSDASSLPEVAGDAALLFDPRDERAIAAAVSALLGEPRLRDELREKGLARAREFTWDRTAQLTLASYARALAPRFGSWLE